MASDESLRALYTQMCHGRADWESLAWDEAPLATCPQLLPSALTAAAFPRTWPALDPDQRTCLTRLQLACETEVFIYLEHAIVAAAQGVLAALPPDAAAAPALAKLVEEEYNHIQQFQRYLRTRLPELYPPAGFTYRFKPHARVRAFTALVARVARRAPSAGLLWGEYFELLTIQLHAVLRELAHDTDPLLGRLHQLHAREEARHVALDRIVIADDYDRRGLPGRVARSWGSLGIFAVINDIERAGFAALIARFVRDDPARERHRATLLEDVRLTERTALFERTAARFAPEFRKLEPLVGRALFERVMLRGSMPGAA
jgi:hypothetical protein